MSAQAAVSLLQWLTRDPYRDRSHLTLSEVSMREQEFQTRKESRRP